MKQAKGIVHKRQQAILQYLKENKTIKTDELSKILSVSPITIRRDIQLFEDQGIVERFYGGATLIEGALNDDPSLLDSSNEYLSQKEAIAKYAAALIENGDTIFINSSSTALLALQYLEDKRVTVITNNGNALSIPKGPNVELVLTGGEVNDRKKTMVGDFATHIINKITADKCILGVSGISAEYGIGTSILQETTINEMMLRRCKGAKIIVADSSKVGKEHNFSSGRIEDISYLITDIYADETQLNLLNNKGITVKTVKTENK